MTKGVIAKFSIAIIIGFLTAHFWSIGEQRLAMFLIATTLFHIFFIIGEEKKIVISNAMTKKDFSNLFAEEMEKWKKNNLFK